MFTYGWGVTEVDTSISPTVWAQFRCQVGKIKRIVTALFWVLSVKAVLEISLKNRQELLDWTWEFSGSFYHSFHIILLFTVSRKSLKIAFARERCLLIIHFHPCHFPFHLICHQNFCVFFLLNTLSTALKILNNLSTFSAFQTLHHTSFVTSKLEFAKSIFRGYIV